MCWSVLNRSGGMKVYIAGPMTGIDKFNFPAFDQAAMWLGRCGYDVVSPAQLDRDAGFDPKDYLPERDLAGIVRRDVNAVLECDSIFMLDGWEKSRGARAEWELAVWSDKTIMYEAGVNG